jgi:hypothetical protein
MFFATTQNAVKKVEMLFAHMKRILKMDRLRLRGLSGARDDFFNRTGRLSTLVRD